MLIKLKAENSKRDEVSRLVDIFRGKVIDVTDSTFVVELTGKSAKLDAFIKAAHEEAIVEVVRSGPLGIGRGSKGLKL
jgi:acetolactate synthase-1/3 small subunit